MGKQMSCSKVVMKDNVEGFRKKERLKSREVGTMELYTYTPSSEQLTFLCQRDKPRAQIRENIVV